VRSHEMQIGNP